VHRIHYRFGIVLALIIVAVFFVMAAPSGDVARFVSVTLQAAVLVAAVVASKMHRWVIRLSIAAAIVGVVGSAAALFGTGHFGSSSAGIVALLYVLLTPPVIATGVMKQFREEGTVTIHSMFGVLCLHLLIGLIFGVLYASLQDLGGTDFFTTQAGRAPSARFQIRQHPEIGRPQPGALRTQECGKFGAVVICHHMPSVGSSIGNRTAPPPVSSVECNRRSRNDHPAQGVWHDRQQGTGSRHRRDRTAGPGDHGTTARTRLGSPRIRA
jgi:hypothetical protein